jgi:hypothetical protein
MTSLAASRARTRRGDGSLRAGASLARVVGPLQQGCSDQIGGAVLVRERAAGYGAARADTAASRRGTTRSQLGAVAR